MKSKEERNEERRNNANGEEKEDWMGKKSKSENAKSEVGMKDGQEV